MVANVCKVRSHGFKDRVIDQHFSMNFQKLTVMINYRNRHPRMTDVLRTLIKGKNTLHSKSKVTNSRQTFHDYNIKKNLLKSAL